MALFSFYLLAAGLALGIAISMIVVAALIRRQDKGARVGCGLVRLGILALLVLAAFCLVQAWLIGQTHIWY